MALWTLPGGAASWVPPVTSGAPATTTVVAHATPHTEGAWTEVIARTPDVMSGFEIVVGATNAAGADTSTLMDVGIGAAGSEIVALADLQIGARITNLQWLPVINAPLTIPAGARVSVRTQSVVTSKSCTVMFIPRYGVTGWGTDRLGTAVTYGADAAASRGVAVTAGNAAEGSWAELSAATTAPIRRMFIGVSSSTATGNSNVAYDIGVGGSGAEVAVLTNIPGVTNSNEATNLTIGHAPVALNIPEGVRLSVRANASAASVGTLYVVAHTFC